MQNVYKALIESSRNQFSRIHTRQVRQLEASYKPETKTFKKQNDDERDVKHLINSGLSKIAEVTGRSLTTREILASLDLSMKQHSNYWHARDARKMQLINIILKNNDQSFMRDARKLNILRKWGKSLHAVTASTSVTFFKSLNLQ